MPCSWASVHMTAGIDRAAEVRVQLGEALAAQLVDEGEALGHALAPLRDGGRERRRRPAASGIVSSRSTGSALKTKRTWRSATGPPQPIMAVAAIALSSSRRREAVGGSRPSAATSRSSDQPPPGADDGPAGEAGEHRVAPPLELGDALGDVILLAAQDRGAGGAGDPDRRRRVVDVRPAGVLDGLGRARPPSRRASRSSGAPSRASRRRSSARPCPRSGAGGRAAGRRRAAAPSPSRR